VNGKKVAGAVSYEEMQAWSKRLIRRRNRPPQPRRPPPRSRKSRSLGRPLESHLPAVAAAGMKTAREAVCMYLFN